MFIEIFWISMNEDNKRGVRDGLQNSVPDYPILNIDYAMRGRYMYIYDAYSLEQIVPCSPRLYEICILLYNILICDLVERRKFATLFYWKYIEWSLRILRFSFFDPQKTSVLPPCTLSFISSARAFESTVSNNAY